MVRTGFQLLTLNDYKLNSEFGVGRIWRLIDVELGPVKFKVEGHNKLAFRV